jgi:predicted lipoprotein with Yx(FWY)xxD motif
MRHHLATCITTAIVLGLGLAGSTQQASAEGVTLQVSEKEPFGKYLTDAEGRSLYLFEGDSKLTSTCYDACAAAWPPLLAEREPMAGMGVDKAMLATLERKDGSMQVGYNGWPLYYFVRDEEPGDTNGQDVEGFGAEWYLISAEGEKVEEEEE